MKFSNGCWLNAERTALFSPAQVWSARQTEESLRLLLPTARIQTRGDTLGGVNLTLEITSPAAGILHLRAAHFAGGNSPSPSFPLNAQQADAFSCEETEEGYTVHSGDLSVFINREDASVSFYHDKKRLTGFSGKDLAYVRTDWRGSFAYNAEAEDAYMRCQLDLSVGEQIYGLGERFGPLVKNGQQIDIYNEDGGTSTTQAYKNIPFYLSSRGYGVFVNHPERVSFEIGSEFVSKSGFSVPGETLDFYLFDGPSLKDVLRRYTDLTGKPGLPAPWTFGLWLSTSFTTDYDEKTVTSFVDGMAERGIPLSVFHFDCYWMQGFHWCDFTWDPELFPDPAGMLARLKAKGLRICVWINPYIAQESSLFEEGRSLGVFLRREDCSVWQWDMWQPGMALVDFTNPEARRWYCEKLSALLDIGVDAFKTDFGERIPVEGVVWHDGSDPARMHNYYTYLYNETVYQLLQQRKGKDAVLFARSATAGCQKFPVHWGGDCWSSYEAMAQSLRGGLSLTASGFGFWSHDIGGFEHTSTADVYKRWLAFGLLSSHSRLHGSQSYRVPWLYDEEAVDVARFFTKLKCRLMPTLWRLACEAHETGVPVMRMMLMEFQDDPVCAGLDRQYMLGDSLLVAPIFNDEGMAEYWLPEGSWVNVLTGELRGGGRFIREKHGYLSVPLWQKPGTILVLGAEETSPEYNYARDALYIVAPLADGQSSRTWVPGPDGQQIASLEALRQGNAVRIRYAGDAPCTVRLAGGSSSRFEAAGEKTLPIVSASETSVTRNCSVVSAWA